MPLLSSKFGSKKPGAKAQLAGDKITCPTRSVFADGNSCTEVQYFNYA